MPGSFLLKILLFFSINLFLCSAALAELKKEEDWPFDETGEVKEELPQEWPFIDPVEEEKPKKKKKAKKK